MKKRIVGLLAFLLAATLMGQTAEENFPNKFTAEYLFLINQTNSVIPRVNRSSRDRKAALDAQWKELRSRAQDFVNVVLPNYNKALWNAGIGAIQIVE